MGGSAEDKSMYNSVGLLRRGPRCYVLDSTDPAKLKQILEDIAKRSQGSIENALQSTLVVGMAMGMTSFEPVVNLEKLAALYAKYKVESRPHFIYMTLPKSLLDRFGRERPVDRGHVSIKGRHLHCLAAFRIPEHTGDGRKRQGDTAGAGGMVRNRDVDEAGF
jgi:hypothetical protein